MKRNELTVEIDCPVQEVFEFTINPANTPKWIIGIVKEETSQWPIRIGTVYKNVDNLGNWNEYKVTKLKVNSFFELMQKDGNYFVRYVYTPLSESKTHLKYIEWVKQGEISNPFTQEILNKLKFVIEAKK
jgi:hypothetical protein